MDSKIDQIFSIDLCWTVLFSILFVDGSKMAAKTVSRGLLGGSWVVLGGFWAALRRSWAALGGVLGGFWAVLRGSWAALGLFWNGLGGP